MSAERAYVERVSLKSPSRAALKGVIPELEDALRTTSWPSPAGRKGAVLLIRKLDLGRIKPGSSRHHIGRLMSSKLNEMTLMWTVPGAEPDGAEAMLWVSETALLASCAIALLGANARGAQPWWVASGVKAAAASSSYFPALRVRLMDVVRASGPAALVAVLGCLIEANRADVAIKMLNAFPELIDGFADEFLKSASKVAVLKMDIAASPDDPLSVVSEETTRALHFSCLDFLPVPARKIWAAIIQGQTQKTVELQVQIALLVVLLRGTAAPVSWPNIERQIIQKMSTFHARKLASAEMKHAVKLMAKRQSADAKSEPKFPPFDAVNAQRLRAAIPDQNQRAKPVTSSFDALATRAGGMPMLLNLIHMTGLPDVDIKAGTDISLRVLHRFIARIPDNDAMQEALPDLPDMHPFGDSKDVPKWMPPLDILVPFSSRLVRIKEPIASGLYGIGLRGTNMLLGIASKDDLGAIEVLDRPIEISCTAFKGDIAGALVDGITLLLQRHLFALTGAGWRHSAVRLGYVATTTTHIDVTLDLDDVDIAERMAGLDLNPGWVAWLWRVVTLHFEVFVKAGRMQ